MSSNISYRKLTEGQRYQIFALLSEEFSHREIAKKLNIVPSTVNRELQRNNNLCGSYDPQKAQERTLKRRSKPKPKRVCENTRNAVELMLGMDWSPEQISAICKRLGHPVSHEWIYNYVLADFYGGSGLFTHLRHRLRRYKKSLHKQRGRILGRRSVHDRPAIINEWARYGDRKIDTVIGKRGTGAIVTLLERKSRFYLVKKATRNHADAIAEATIEILQPFKTMVHSITADNVLEFADHERKCERVTSTVCT